MPDLSAPGQPAVPAKLRRLAVRKRSTSPSLSQDRRRLVSAESGLLQPAARLLSGVPRVHAVAVLHRGRHQLHAEPSDERLQRARLETRSAGVAHLSSLPVPVEAVRPAAAAGRPRLQATVRRPRPPVAREAVHSAVQSRQAVADLAAAMQPAASHSVLHVSCNRVEAAD